MRILFLHEYALRPDRSGCDIRLLQIVLALRKAAHEVTFIARYPVAKQEYYEDLCRYGVDLHVGDQWDHDDAYRYWFESPSFKFRKILQKGFDIAILPLWFWHHVTIPDDFLDQLRAYSPQTRVVVLTDDSQGRRQQLVAAVTGERRDQELALDYRQREREFYRAADAVLTISAVERDYIAQLVPDQSVFIIPYSANVQPVGPSFDERTGLLLVANFENAASVDAAEWFIKSVWSRVRDRIPSVRFTLAGNASQSLVRLGGPSVECTGYCEKLDSLFYSNRLFISPMRFGTGISTKNIMAMSFGLPTITTEIGAQSLGDVKQFVGVTRTDTPDEFLREILDAYLHQDRWERMAVGSRGHVTQHFSPEMTSMQVDRMVESLIAMRPKRSDTVDLTRDTDQPLVRNRYPCRDRSGIGQLELGDILLGRGDVYGAKAQFRYALSRWGEDRLQDIYYARAIAGLEQCAGVGSN